MVMSWLLPNHYYPWVSFYNDFSAFLALIVLSGFFIFSQGFPISATSLSLMVVACVPVVQWSFGKIFFLGDALIASSYLFGAALAVVSGRMVFFFLGARAFECMAWIILVGAILSCWVALRQWLGFDGNIWVVDLSPGGRPYANLSQPNNLATLLCMSLVSILYLWERFRLGRFSAALVALYLIVGVAITQSRTPWLGALCILVWWSCKAQRANMRLSVSWLTLWVGVYAVAVLALPYLADALYLSAVNLVERAQALHRIELWRQLWMAILHGGWWGYGWNQVSVAQIGVSLGHSVQLMSEHSHNIFLDILIWNGPLLGGGVALLVLAHFSRLAWRIKTCEGVFALLVIGLVFLHGLLEFPLEYGFFLLPIGILLGMLEGEQSIPEVFVLPRWGSGSALLVGVLVLGWVWHDYRLLEEDHRLLRFESARIGEVKAERIAPDVHLLTQLREFLQFARTQAQPSMTADQLEWMRRVVYRYPYPPSLFRYSLALALNGKPELARLELMRLQALHGDALYQEARQGMATISERYPQLESFWLVDHED